MDYDTGDAEVMTRYLDAWTAASRQDRHHIISQLWLPQGQLTISSTGQTYTGPDEITAHIEGVHTNLVVGKGLLFSYSQHLRSGDAFLLRWAMTSPTSEVVGRGVDILHLTNEGRITSAYMFMGVN